MFTILDPAYLEKVFESQYAIVFIDVDWAIHSMHSKFALKAVEAHIERVFPAAYPVYRVDISEEADNPLYAWLYERLKTECGKDRARGVLWGGWGAVIYIRSGRVAETVEYAHMAGVTTLLEIAAQQFDRRVK